MRPHRNTSIVVGILFLVVNVTFLAGVLTIDSVLSSPVDLGLVSARQGMLVLGVLLELINGVAYVGIAMLMFPLIREQSLSLALGYVAFRAVEFAMQIGADVSVLSLVGLSGGSASASTPAIPSSDALSNLLLSQRQAAFLMVTLTFALGALFFYSSLVQSLLVPRFISIWGLIGAAVVLVTGVMEMFGVNPGNFGVLMLLNELFLGVWLIVKGFNPAMQTAEALADPT